MTSEDQAKKQRAKEFARRVIEGEFKQTIDDETLDTVAEKILKALPDNPKEPQVV